MIFLVEEREDDVYDEAGSRYTKTPSPHKRVTRTDPKRLATKP